MSIAANKVKGIRCALVHDVFSAKATRQHNDSNILAMGERVIGPGTRKRNRRHMVKHHHSKAAVTNAESAN